MSSTAAAPGTIVIFADVTCPWAHLAVHRLHETRARLRLDDEVVLDIRAFPLELVNAEPTPKPIVEAEIPVVGGLEPDAGWRMWERPAHEWPSTALLALEAVQAAKEQGLRASEALDRALRRAFFAESRPIGMRHEVLAVAAETGAVDVTALKDALVAGRARGELEAQLAISLTDEVRGSPHVFLPDGADVHNPGIELRWEGRWGADSRSSSTTTVRCTSTCSSPPLARRCRGRP